METGSASRSLDALDAFKIQGAVTAGQRAKRRHQNIPGRASPIIGKAASIFIREIEDVLTVRQNGNVSVWRPLPLEADIHPANAVPDPADLDMRSWIGRERRYINDFEITKTGSVRFNRQLDVDVTCPVIGLKVSGISHVLILCRAGKFAEMSIGGGLVGLVSQDIAIETSQMDALAVYLDTGGPSAGLLEERYAL